MSTLLLNPRQMYAPDPEQQPVAAGVLTVVVHVLFAAVLFLNMSWQQKIRPQASVKLWEAMPTTPAKAMPATPVKAERPRKRKPVTPAKPDFQPAPDQLRTPMTQAAPVAVSPAVPPPPAPRIDIAPAQTIAPPHAELAAPKREHVAKPVPDSISAESAEPPPTYSPTQIVDVSQPDRAQIAASRADLATPTRERIDMPAPDSVNVEPFEPPPEYAPKKIVDVSRTVEPQIAPPGTDLAAPQRQPVEKAPASVSSGPVEPLPKYTPTTIEQQPGRKPEIDVDALRRDRALALAEQLRDEEDSRLNESLDRERVERKEEAKKRREEREAKLARELQEISAAARQRLAELQAQQAQDAAAQSLADDYRARISAKIRQRVILPPDMRGNPQAIYEVSLLPGGEVTQVRLLQSSGVLTYDAAVERAILAAQPLPVPEDPELFHAIFKNFFLSFRPKE